MAFNDGRISWPDYFMSIASLVAERSTCLRRKVGAVAIRNSRILATGYNGAPSGIPHCLDAGCMREKMGVPSGERHELCMAGETQVKLLNGTYESLEALAEKGEDFWTYACDTSGNLVPALATQPRLTGNRTDLVKVTLDNGSSFSCTKDHKIMLRNGDFEEAGNLEVGTSLMPMFFNYSYNNKYESVSNTVRCRIEGGLKKEYLGKTPSTPTHILVYSHFWGEVPKGMEIHHKNHNHKVASVVPLEGEYPVYDVSVPGYENFAIRAGDDSCVFAHNCMAVHAEQNLIVQAALHGISLHRADIYCTHKPCFICAKMLVNVGVKSIVTSHVYPDDNTDKLLLDAGVRLIYI